MRSTQSKTFSYFDSTHLQELFVEHGRPEKIDLHQMVKNADSDTFVFYMTGGFIKRYLITNEGGQSIQAIYGPGNVFPLTAIMKKLFNRDLYQGRETFFYETMTNTELYRLETEKLFSALEENPHLHQNLLEITAKRLHSNIQRLENMSYSNSYRRIAHQLLYYAMHYSKRTARGYKIDIPLTHNDIAAILNIARETVSREIVKLRDDGFVVSTDSHEMIVPNIEALEELVYGAY